jgi:chemotaxis protein CheX
MISAGESSRMQAHPDQREKWLPVLELSVREVFAVMLESELQPLPADRPADALEVTAMVGLAGSLCGVLSFRCGFPAATHFTSKMLAREVSDSDEQAGDAVGEICNMIAGNFKSKVTGLKDSCVLSPPTVVTGSDYRMHSLVTHCLQVVLLYENWPVSVALELRM